MPQLGPTTRPWQQCSTERESELTGPDLCTPSRKSEENLDADGGRRRLAFSKGHHGCHLENDGGGQWDRTAPEAIQIFFFVCFFFFCKKSKEQQKLTNAEKRGIERKARRQRGMAETKNELGKSKFRSDRVHLSCVVPSAMIDIGF
jgi:hypothetical protein